MPTELYLVDTSAWILALRKDSLQAAKDRIEFLLNENLVLITEMVKLELLRGARTEKEFHRLKSRLDALPALPSDKPFWEYACEFAFALRRKGVTAPYTDILIASSALMAKAVLFHADHHFDMMASKIGLKVESLLTTRSRR